MIAYGREPDALDAGNDDAAALRALLLRQRDLFPALRRDNCPPQTIADYQRLSGAITALRMRLGPVRFYQIKAEVNR